ncbi:leucine--tRNA ligase [Tanacetum coccineum]
MSKSAERAPRPADSVKRNTAGKGSKQATDSPPGFLPKERLRKNFEKHYNQLLPIMTEKVHQEKLQGVQTRLTYGESSQRNSQTREKTQLSQSESCDTKRRSKKSRKPNTSAMSRGYYPSQSPSVFSRLKQGEQSSSRPRSPISTTNFTRLELVDALKRKKVDIACFQETKWKGSHNKEGNQYKLWYSGSTTARNGVGVVLAPNLKNKVVEVSRISDRIMMVRLVIEEETISVISAYALQVGHGEAKKKSFWDSLDDLVKECSMSQQHLIIAGDLNGHIGAEADGFSSVHGGFGYGVRNEEGRTILEFAAAHDLVVVNSFFKKRDAHLITYHSGDHDTQIDYMLVRRGDLRVCKDNKVFPGEVCFSQHRLLALDINIKRRPRSTKMAVKPRILWKNLHGEAAEAFRTRVTEGVTPELGGRTTTDAEQMWNRLANTIREAAKETLGVVAHCASSRLEYMPLSLKGAVWLVSTSIGAFGINTAHKGAVWFKEKPRRVFGLADLHQSGAIGSAADMKLWG